MINFGVIMLLVSLACFGLVLWMQICRIDKLTCRLEVCESRAAVATNVFASHNRILRSVSNHLDALKQRAFPGESSKSLELIPGDVHPFTPDAFVTTSDTF